MCCFVDVNLICLWVCLIIFFFSFFTQMLACASVFSLSVLVLLQAKSTSLDINACCHFFFFFLLFVIYCMANLTLYMLMMDQEWDLRSQIYFFYRWSFGLLKQRHPSHYLNYNCTLHTECAKVHKWHCLLICTWTCPINICNNNSARVSF